LIDETCLRKARYIAVAAAMVTVVALTGCGSASHGPVVARVGAVSIGKDTVDHWAQVIRKGGLGGGLGESLHGSPRERALGFLISSVWLTGEARREGVAISDRAVERAVARRKEANGVADFEEGLRATGETVDDVKLEVRAELAAEALRWNLARAVAPATQVEVVRFYRANAQLFRVPEKRVVDLIERLPSPAAAKSLVARIGTGERFAKMAFHETLTRVPSEMLGTAEKPELVRAIFAARPGVVSKPTRLSQAWTVFVVRKSTPERREPLADVRGAIVSRITALRRRALAGKRDEQYRRRWVSMTSCARAYVVPGCAKYHGSQAVGEPFLGA
jgi:hypothetical protein